jgi:hypothetical protein
LGTTNKLEKGKKIRSKKMKIKLLSVFLIANLSLFSQDYYKKIEESLIECGIKVYNKLNENQTLIIETDSITSNNYSKIHIESFNNLIEISEHNKIESLIKRKYIGKEILSFRKTKESYGALYAYVINNPKGNPNFDKYIVKKYKNKSILISYNSIMGNKRNNFKILECMIKKMEK